VRSCHSWHRRGLLFIRNLPKLNAKLRVAARALSKNKSKPRDSQGTRGCATTVRDGRGVRLYRCAGAQRLVLFGNRVVVQCNGAISRQCVAVHGCAGGKRDGGKRQYGPIHYRGGSQGG